MPTLVNLVNNMADFQTKCIYLAEKVTRQYLDQNLDEGARVQLEWYRHNYSERLFLRVFFDRYSNVFEGNSITWTCRNPSAAAIALLREMFED
jgi:hypothetical protein